MTILSLECAIIMAVTTSHSLCISMLNVAKKITFPVEHVKNCIWYDHKCPTESFPRRWRQQREVLLISVLLKKCRLSLLVTITHQPWQWARFSANIIGKQLEHLPLSTSRHTLTLSFSMAVVSEKSSISSWHTRSLTGCQPFWQHENYEIALVSLHVLNTRNKFENYIQ